MGDESMASGMSSVSEAAPAGGPAGGAAEGIMKKLSNYWLIVGSVPLVLFLLVCLPTVFYVKSISDYKNAYYCRSKACDTLAAATKGVRDGKPCDDYFGAVCSAAKTFTLKEDMKRDTKLIGAAANSWGDSGNPRGSPLTWAAGCIVSDYYTSAPSKSVFELIGLNKATLKDDMTKPDTITKVFKEAQKRGIDCLFHLEWVQSTTKMLFADAPKPSLGEDLPPDPKPLSYDLAVSIPDMRLMEPNLYLVTLGGLKYEDASKIFFSFDEVDIEDDDFRAATAAALKKIYEFIEYCKDLDFMAAPEIVPDTQFGTVVPATNLAFGTLIGEIVSGYKRYLVRSPNYVKLLALALNGCLTPDLCAIKMDELAMFVVIDTALKLRGYSSNPTIDDDLKQLWCLRYHDWYTASGFNVVVEKYLQIKYWPFALSNPKDAKSPLPSSSVGYNFLSLLLDSFQQSYSLSEASSEKSRAGLYLKILQMEYFAFYKNSTNNVDAGYLDVISPKTGYTSDNPAVHELWENRKGFYDKYWSVNNRMDPKYLIGRHALMYSDDEGSYDYGTNTMYVPFGMFRPQYYRDSRVYMGNYATFGYYGSMNILKLLDNAGGYTKAGYQHPVLWTGTYAMGKMKWQYRCLNQENANNTDARLVAKGSKPITPGFRFFRRQALARAYPRPEYRLDVDAKADMEQIYLTAVMRTYCRYKRLKESVNKMFSHDMYYQKAYCSDSPGKMKKAPDQLCYIWRTTRREY